MTKNIFKLMHELDLEKLLDAEAGAQDVSPRTLAKAAALLADGLAECMPVMRAGIAN